MDTPGPFTPADLAIRAASPALWAALSALGRRAQVPENFLPQQTAEARGKRWNATIGQITDGRGGALPLSPMAAALAGLAPALRNQAFLYSPVEGLLELRRRWRERQRGGHPAPAPNTAGTSNVPSSLPIVTAGTGLALALAADLFLSPERTVALPDPHPPGYPEVFTLKSGARPSLFPAPEGRPEPAALAALLARVPAAEPAVAVLRTPLSDGGPVLGNAERQALRDVLAAAAEERPLVVVLDDSWERGGSSLFWDLAGLHPHLLPVKVDGPGGALGFPGGGVGFLTLPFDPESEVARAMEGKMKMLLRAVVGSPPALGQAVLLAALQGR